MRLIAERAGIFTYVSEYQLAPEAKYPVQLYEIESWFAGCSTTPLTRKSIPQRSRSAGIPQAGT
jgi:hypothetical protein